MKLAFSAFLLSFPSVSLGFTAANVVAKQRGQPLEMGFIRNFFNDRSDPEKDGSKVLVERFKEPIVKDARELGADLRESTEEDEKIIREIKEDGIFAYVPTKEMTGVEPHMARLCSTISSQLYEKISIDEFKLSTKDHTAEVLLYDDHELFKDATVPFAVVVSGDTMILGWRGTSTLLDGFNDIAASPQASLAWRKHAKSIKVQGAFTSIVQNDIANHEKKIIKEIKERGIREIVTTGQSLGGGAAQVAHLTLRAQTQDELSPWYEVKDVNVRSVGFCGPMTTVFIDNATPETDTFVEELWDNSCNMIYSNDVVPRGYGYLSFVDDFVQNAQGDLVNNIPLPWAVKRIINVREKVENLIDSVTENKSVQSFLDILSQYRHVGNVIYYETEDSKPIVLKDMGAFYKNSAKEKNILREVKYKPVEKPIDEFMGWHMDIISGPGLSYPENELS